MNETEEMLKKTMETCEKALKDIVFIAKLFAYSEMKSKNENKTEEEKEQK